MFDNLIYRFKIGELQEDIVDFVYSHRVWILFVVYWSLVFGYILVFK